MTRKIKILSLKKRGLSGAEIARRLGLSKYQVYYITNHDKRVAAVMKWRKANLERYLAYHKPYEKQWWKNKAKS